MGGFFCFFFLQAHCLEGLNYIAKKWHAHTHNSALVKLTVNYAGMSGKEIKTLDCRNVEKVSIKSILGAILVFKSMKSSLSIQTVKLHRHHLMKQNLKIKTARAKNSKRYFQSSFTEDGAMHG